MYDGGRRSLDFLKNFVVLVDVGDCNGLFKIGCRIAGWHHTRESVLDRLLCSRVRYRLGHLFGGIRRLLGIHSLEIATSEGLIVIVLIVIFVSIFACTGMFQFFLDDRDFSFLFRNLLRCERWFL